jgi:hypothetical protein
MEEISIQVVSPLSTVMAGAAAAAAGAAVSCAKAMAGAKDAAAAAPKRPKIETLLNCIA